MWPTTSLALSVTYFKRAWDWYRIYFHHIIIRAPQTNFRWSNALRHALEFVWHVLWKCIHSKDNSIKFHIYGYFAVSPSNRWSNTAWSDDLFAPSNTGDTIRWTKKLDCFKWACVFRWLSCKLIFSPLKTFEYFTAFLRTTVQPFPL